MQVCLYTFLHYVHTYTCIYMYMYMYTYTCMYAHTYIYISTHTNTSVYVYTHLLVPIPQPGIRFSETSGWWFSATGSAGCPPSGPRRCPRTPMPWRVSVPTWRRSWKKLQIHYAQIGEADTCACICIHTYIYIYMYVNS